MSKQTLILMGVLAATFGAGIVVGFFLSNDPSRSDLTQKVSATGSTANFFSSAAAQDREQNNTLLSSRIRELEKEKAEQKSDPVAIMQAEFAFFKKYRNQGLYLQGFSADPSPQQPVVISSAMADFLKLTDTERQATEQTLTQAKNAMVSLKDADAVVAKQTPNSISYEVPPDPKGKVIKDQLTQDLVQNLGPDRAGFLLDSNGFTGPMSAFGGFSEQQTDIQINWTTQAGKQLYTWKVINNGSESSNETPSDWIPEQIKKYVPTPAP